MLYILILLMILTFSFQSLFTRLYSANYQADEKLATPVFSICFGVFIAVASLVVGGFSFAPSWQTLGLGVLTAAMLVLYNKSMIEAGNRGSYAFMMIAAMFGGILVPMAVGVCFLGETLAAHQIAAVVLMLISLVAMNVRGIEFRGNSKAYYLWCILLFFANGLFGTLLNLQAEVMDGAQRTEMLTTLYAVSAAAAVLMTIPGGRHKQLAQGFRGMGKKAALFLILCCVSATAAANLQLYILSLMDSAIYYTISDGSVLVVSIIFSLILFKERPRWEQVIGMVMAVASIVLINTTGEQISSLLSIFGM